MMIQIYTYMYMNILFLFPAPWNKMIVSVRQNAGTSKGSAQVIISCYIYMDAWAGGMLFLLLQYMQQPTACKGPERSHCETNLRERRSSQLQLCLNTRYWMLLAYSLPHTSHAGTSSKCRQNALLPSIRRCRCFAHAATSSKRPHNAFLLSIPGCRCFAHAATSSVRQHNAFLLSIHACRCFAHANIDKMHSFQAFKPVTALHIQLIFLQATANSITESEISSNSNHHVFFMVMRPGALDKEYVFLTCMNLLNFSWFLKMKSLASIDWIRSFQAITI